LNVGSVTEAVVVSTDIPLLKTENGEQTTTLEAKEMSQLPQVGQNWENFAILLPGSQGAPSQPNGVLGAGQVVSVNGNLPYSSVLADGATSTLSHSANADVSVFETVQEVQISTSAFSAQYGVGGIIFNQISKGGTNQFHGAVYEYFQNDALNAATYAFSNRTRQQALSKLRYNNFGGSIGGPILRKKAFFYFNFDKIQQQGGANTGTITVPTVAMRNGDFSGQPTIYDPATTTVVGGVIKRTPFTGNVIPAGRLDAVAKAIQAYYPAPNAAGTTVNGQTKNTTSTTYRVPTHSRRPLVAWTMTSRETIESQPPLPNVTTRPSTQTRASAPSIARVAMLKAITRKSQMCGLSVPGPSTKCEWAIPIKEISSSLSHSVRASRPSWDGSLPRQMSFPISRSLDQPAAMSCSPPRMPFTRSMSSIHLTLLR
jgi:hypothetical protein